MYDGDIASTLVTEQAIREKTAELAEQIGADYAADCSGSGRSPTCCSSACSRARSCS